MRVLIVEDDIETQCYVSQGLVEAGHSVEASANGADGLLRARQGGYDLFIVDRMVPELDGLSLVKAIRSAGIATPVLMLTAMGAVSDRVDGLEAGADDYLVKPFSFAELSARVNALARSPPLQADTKLVVGDLVLDRLLRRVRRGETEVDLQTREFQLLELMMLNAGRVVTRTMMLESVWNFRFDPGTNIVETHMSRIRSKIDRGDDAPLIHTIRGEGYVIRAD
ncbi:response regulator in two-component regulatory system with PhoQ [alpha proteobacterium U9-1i]|nr:response regulator in two-component regulatory system with PhoQ [alpha proteobacterium U9-1i]